jgi:hypothetical protein
LLFPNVLLRLQAHDNIGIARLRKEGKEGKARKEGKEGKVRKEGKEVNGRGKRRERRRGRQ